MLYSFTEAYTTGIETKGNRLKYAFKHHRVSRMPLLCALAIVRAFVTEHGKVLAACTACQDCSCSKSWDGSRQSA